VGVDGPDDLDQEFHGARRLMLEAFVDLSNLARHYGIPAGVITDLHGRFFDGNVQVKRAWEVLRFDGELRDL
jgi:hypothetical protein